MKRNTLSSILQQVQRQNLRLRQEGVNLRRQLKAFEDKMMRELTRLDPTKIMFDSPVLCLNAFLEQLASITEDHEQRSSHIEQLQHKLRLSERTNDRLYKETQSHLKRIAQMEEKVSIEAAKVTNSQQQLKLYVRQSQVRSNSLERQLSQMAERMELKQIKIEEEKRVAVSAIIHQSKKQMIDFREQLQNEFLNDSQKLRQEIKQKDEKIKKLLKGLLKFDNGQKVAQNEITEMRELVKYIGNVESLNITINELRDQIHLIKKEQKDTLNKKSIAQLKNIELRNEISNHLLKAQRKEEEKRLLQLAIDGLRAELTAQKQSNKKLQHYFEQKWHNEFEKVKSHLDKAFDEKVINHEKDLEVKKAQVSRKIESYLFIHNEDKKIIADLKKRVEALSREVQSKKILINHEKQQFKQLKREMAETDFMAAEEVLSVQQKWQNKLLRKQKQIIRLDQQLNHRSLDKKSFQNSTKKLSLQLQQKFTKEKQLLQQQHAKQQQTLSLQRQNELQMERHRFQEMLFQMRNTIKEMQIEQEFTINDIKIRLGAEIQSARKELELQKIKGKQFATGAEGRQRALKKEILDLKQYYMKKILDLQRQLQNKKTNLKVIASKSDNDEDLKKQMRLMLEQRINQCHGLARVKQDLMDSLQARQSEIHHLNLENTGLRMSKEDWLKLIVEVRDDLLQELSQLNEYRSRQVQFLKSRIWELENIISKRPIRIQDQRKIRSLSEAKRELENKIDIKQAQNIVLKQIKQYYQKKNQTTPQIAYENQVKKTQTVLIMAKRPRRTKVNFQPQRKEDDDGQTNQDIQKMRKYLEKFRSTHHEGRQPFKQKIRPSSRTKFNRSLQS